MKFFNISVKYPRSVVLVIVLLTVFFSFQALKVTMTTDIKDFFPDGHPQVETYHRIEQVFGAAEYIMVALELPEIFSSAGLAAVDGLTQQLMILPGVKEVRSLTTIEEIRAGEYGLELSPLIAEVPAEPGAMLNLQNRVLNDPFYSGVIVSADGSAALQIIELEPEADSIQVADAVAKVVREWQGPGTLYLTGTPVLNNVLAKSMQADLKVLLPLVMAIIALILYLYFRSLRGVLLPFLTVLISLIWTLGLMGALGKQISPLNAVMPIILVSLGNAYGIYILSRQREELAKGAGRNKATLAALASVGIAVLMAGVTTIAGFASNVTSQITQMRQFGIFTGFGIMVALLISLLLIPAMLTLFSEERKPAQSVRSEGSRLTYRLGHGVIRHYRLILILSVGIVLFAIAGLPRLNTDSNFFNFFADDSIPKQAYNLVKARFIGSESIEIVITGNLQDPAILQAMDALQQDMEKTGLVGKPFSLANVLKRTNLVLHDNLPEYDRIPASEDEIAQYLLLMEMNDTSYLQKFTTLDYSEGRIQALVRDSSKTGTQKIMQAVSESYTKHFTGLDTEITITGIVVLMDALAELIIQGQIYSLLFSLVAVFFVVLYLLRSLEGSILSVLLIGLVTLINFGIMGWFGISLDIVTVLISSIGVGVGIDYSLHIYSRYKEEFTRTSERKQALVQAIDATGKPIIVNAGAVISGFIILLFSSFPPLRFFGSLVTTIMLAASLGALTFVPAMVLFSERFFGRSQVEANQTPVK